MPKIRIYLSALLVVAAFFFVLTTAPPTEARQVREIHRWYGGTTYKGIVDMKPLFTFVWKCDGRNCMLKGPYGTGLSLSVCQELASRVGPLTYYVNDAGEQWTETENKKMLDLCNWAHDNKSSSGVIPTTRTGAPASPNATPGTVAPIIIPGRR